MASQNGAYLLALSAAVLFSGASVVFARFAVSHSSLWMNLLKNTVAGIAFFVASGFSILFTAERLSMLSGPSATYLLVSGVVGLAVGDLFLFRAYQRIGSARTIMIFSFSPIFLTVEGFFFFGQGLSLNQAVALLFMIACAWTISFEKFRASGEWEWLGILFALTGVVLDNVGVVLSRMAFDLSPGTSAFTANAVRAVGAVAVLLVVQRFSGERVFRSFGRLEWRDRSLVVFASFLGTFLSLSCWLTAIKIGHIGSLAGVGSFNPVAASLWEWALLRKRPTVYLLVAMALFLTGFFVLLQ
jgi:drug/metabolite transporter (DMT)-like permease